MPTNYALYPPAEPGLPWLAVVLEGYKPVDTFGCVNRETAQRVLVEMRARNAGKHAVATYPKYARHR